MLDAGCWMLDTGLLDTGYWFIGLLVIKIKVKVEDEDGSGIRISNCKYPWYIRSSLQGRQIANIKLKIEDCGMKLETGNLKLGNC